MESRLARTRPVRIICSTGILCAYLRGSADPCRRTLNPRGYITTSSQSTRSTRNHHGNICPAAIYPVVRRHQHLPQSRRHCTREPEQVSSAPPISTHVAVVTHVVATDHTCCGSSSTGLICARDRAGWIEHWRFTFGKCDIGRNGRIAFFGDARYVSLTVLATK